MLLASVLANIPVKSIAKAYTYRVPEELSFLTAGWRVLVPFGKRKVEGFVLDKKDTEDTGSIGDFEIKDILAAVDDEAWFTPEIMAAARWMADFYLCSLAETMRLFMPGKSGLKIRVAYAIAEGDGEMSLPGIVGCAEVCSFLRQHGPESRNALKKALPSFAERMDGLLARLLRCQAIQREYLVQNRDAARYERRVALKRPVDEEFLASYRRRPAQKRLLEILRGKTECGMDELRAQQVSLATIHALEKSGILAVEKRRALRDSYREMPTGEKDGNLVPAQQKALDAISPYLARRERQIFLLHGVTGSGKTRVYIEAARKARAIGRKVVVLVPEIALAGQVAMAFKAWFSREIAIIHSQLSVQERNDAILRIRREEVGVIIGARSALLAPASDIGLIILDEEQDASYKQDESPRYHARAVAEKLAELHRAVLVLGSATPSLESFCRARRGEMILLNMPERIGGHPLPEVHCVDMREELRMGNRTVISHALRALLEETLAKKQQAIIMLNRRGFATFVLCRSCGAVIKCRSCGLPMVYHKNGRLLCHHCDEHAPVPDVCPKCGSRYIKYFGSGTEKLEQELRALLPMARIVRMDRDTTATKFAHQKILSAFREGQYDILLGTQMVAKGHDIPAVTAVGIISADASLNMPDFRAAERCFMLITQTAGRAGRRAERGRVVIQSYNPQHYAVQCGIRQDYLSFYAQEIKMRAQLFYPPFSRIVRLLFQHAKEHLAHAAAKELRDAFHARFGGDEKQKILGPAPDMIACFRGVYRFCLLIKTADIAAVQGFLREQGLHLRTDVAIDIDPIHTT